MSDNRDDIHKQAVLEFLYATAAQAVGSVALVMVEANGDHGGARALMSNPLTRKGFAESVSKELRSACGDVTIRDATVGQVADAAKAASKSVEHRAKGSFAGSTRPPLVVVAQAGPNKAPDATPGSSDFGAN